MLFLAYFVSVSIGFLIIKAILKDKEELNVLSKLSLALILGLGIGGMLTFCSFLIWGQYRQPAIIGLAAALLSLLVFLNRRDFVFACPLRTAIRSGDRSRLIFMGVTAAFFITLAVLSYLVATWIPYGRWDAWALYNMKPKFLIFGGANWTALFDELHWHTQPDYPLLFAFITTWLAGLSKASIHMIALVNAILLTVNCGILLFSSLKQTTSRVVALLIFAVISLNPKFLILGTSQYVDILLASYLLSAVFTLSLALEKNSWRFAALSGLFCGLMTFTKNEGIVIALLLTLLWSAVMLFRFLKKKSGFAPLTAFWTALVTTTSISVIFKLFLAPPNRDMMGKIDISELQYLNWNGFMITFNAFISQFLNKEWSYIWILLGVMLLLGIKRLFRTRNLVLALFFVVYVSVLFYIYMTTRNFDLSWRISVTLDRMLFNLLPALAFWVFTMAFPDRNPLFSGKFPAVIAKNVSGFFGRIKKVPALKNWNSSSLLTITGIIIILAAAYLPVLITEYVYHDDVNLFLKSPVQPLPVSTKTNFLVYGRFLGAAVYMLTSWPVRFISDLQFLRFFTIIQLSLAAWIIFPFVRKLMPNKISAVLLTGTFFTLPAFQVLVANAGMSFDAAGTLLAALAAAITAKISVNDNLMKRGLQARTLIAVLVFLLSLTVHQATAMFYWGVAALVLLANHRDSVKEIFNRAMNFILTGFAGMGLYALMLKAIKPFTVKYIGGMNNPFEMRLDLFAQLQWFFAEPVHNALNLWSVYPTQILAALIKLVIVSGLIIFGFNLFQSDKQRAKMLAARASLLAAAVFVLLVLSFLPNLITIVRQPFYRCLSGVSLIVFGLLIWSVAQWLAVLSRPEKYGRSVTIFCSLLAIYALFAAGNNLFLYRVKPSHTLTKYLKEQFRSGNLQKYKRIHFIHPPAASLKARWDEFGMITPVYAHDWLGLTACGLIERNKGEKHLGMVLVDHTRGSYEFYFLDKNKQKDLEIFSFLISGSDKEIPLRPDESSVLTLDYAQFFGPGKELEYLVRKE
jgi:hypothetical protein